MVKATVVKPATNVGASSSKSTTPCNDKTAGKKPAGNGKRPTVKNQDLPTCMGCSTFITADTRALCCDRCDKDAWKCAVCLGITQEVYDALTATAGSYLKWFCDDCDKIISSVNDDNTTEILKIVTQLLDGMKVLELKLGSLEEAVESKADKTQMIMVQDISSKLQQLETKESEIENMVIGLEATVSDVVARSLQQQMSVEMHDIRGMMHKELEKTDTKNSIEAVEEKVTKLVHTVEKQRTESHELRDCVQDAVREKLEEDKEEMEDIKKRSVNVIVHGFKEKVDENAETRMKRDEDELTEMLHAIKCDDVSVERLVRFGKYSEEQTAPRVLKFTVASEHQRDKVLSRAKNLNGNIRFGKVFIQQDLTVKQRQKRRELVRQLKQRKANGESRLLIVQDRIVVRGQTLPEPPKTD